MISKFTKFFVNDIDWRYKDINFVVGSFNDVTVTPNIVLSLGVLGYQKSQEKFLVDLANQVKGPGYLIFTASNGDSFLRLARHYLSRLYGLIKVRKTKRNGVKHRSIKNKQVINILTKNRLKFKKRVYLTFGLGLTSSSIDCAVDRFLFKYLSNS